LPLVGGRKLYRPSDHARGFPPGILIYPAAVLLLVLAFPSRPDIAAAAWGILAFGDGAATLAGRRFPSAALPWNREKSVAGMIAFWRGGGGVGSPRAGGPGGGVTPIPPLMFALLAPVAAAVAAGLVETIPVRLDDNISVPIAAAAALWFASLASLSAFA